MTGIVTNPVAIAAAADRHRRVTDHAADVRRRLRTNIAFFRRRAGMTQTDLAVAMSEHVPVWTKSLVSFIETGTRDVRVPELVALAVVLDVDVNSLLGQREGGA